MALTPLDAAGPPSALARLYDAPDFHAGCAEPWIAEVLCALLLANNARVAVEVGGFEGFTSKRLACALARLPHDTTLTVCEIDSARATAVAAALQPYDDKHHQSVVVCADSHHWLPMVADASVD